MTESLYVRIKARLGAAGGRLCAALACYAVLLAAALCVLLPVRTSNERFLLGAVLAVFAILAAKTVAHSRDADE
ncbi:MAG: hypothetical protein LBT74_06450 [Acidobacteriota bacterium]|jgi:hypothetical protein|nr:hypothetical protein [Acidobacteriota bacterium]